MRIAIVEDNPTDVRFFEITLNEMGISYDLEHFETPVRAIESFRVNLPPDLIVTDWYMPMMDFPEFMRELRAIPLYGSIRVVVCSGTAAQYISGQTLALGAVCCLEKPVQAEQFRKVFNHLSRSASC